MELETNIISDFVSSKYNRFIKYIKDNNLGAIEENISLKKYCTLHIGGTARCIYKPFDLNNLKLAYKYIISNRLDFFVLGNASNILISDKFHDKIFINLKHLNNVTINKNILYCDAGANAMIVSKNTCRLGYTNLEFLAGIPGTIGGIIYMNAGAWNKQISDYLETVTYLDEFGNLCEMDNINNKGFKYRFSPFQKRKIIIVGCIIKLKLSKDESQPLAVYQEYLNKKKESQPLKSYSAGCAFKNPPHTNAWKLIEGAGCHKLRIGDAAVSEIHHNFLINKNNATFEDMYNLLTLIQEEVNEKYNIMLNSEWTILK